MNEKEIFNQGGFLPLWCDVETNVETNVEEQVLSRAYTEQRKDLTTLLAELEDIKNMIEDAKAREWHLGQLLKFHNAGLKKE